MATAARRPARPAGVGPHDRIPEQQRCGEEANVLRVVPATRAQGEVVKRREVPEPSGGDEDGQRRPRMRQPPEEPAQQRGDQQRRNPVREHGPRQAPEQGEQRRASHRSGGATIMSSRCCSM